MDTTALSKEHKAPNNYPLRAGMLLLCEGHAGFPEVASQVRRASEILREGLVPFCLAVMKYVSGSSF